jgi:hypothetical protein
LAAGPSFIFLALTLEAAAPLFPDFGKSLPCFAEAPSEAEEEVEGVEYR